MKNIQKIMLLLSFIPIVMLILFTGLGYNRNTARQKSKASETALSTYATPTAIADNLQQFFLTIPKNQTEARNTS